MPSFLELKLHSFCGAGAWGRLPVATVAFEAPSPPVQVNGCSSGHGKPFLSNDVTCPEFADIADRWSAATLEI